MASLGSYLPSPGSAVWRRDRRRNSHTESNVIRHIVIRGSEVVTDPAPHVIYRIDVLTEHAHWCVSKRYSEFHDLHKKLVREYRIHKELLPPKKMSGNFSKQLIDSRRQLLEQYLQRLINSEPQISQSKELMTFLDQPSHDVVRVTNILARQLYSAGDSLLEQATPVALTTNDLYCITKRLKLPLDNTSSQTDQAAIDIGHLYSFLHQLHSLKVVPPLPPSSVTRMAFEVTPFRSMHTLKLEGVPLSQVVGLVRVQQQLTHLSAQHCLKSLKELLIESVEERRSAMDTTNSVDSWRLVAMAKFTANRVVVQPWHNLVTLNISYNKLTHIDDSLQVLPALRELNASHNLLMTMDLQYISLPSLQRVNLSHNNISSIISNSMVLESVQWLHLADNMISDLGFLNSFITLNTLNVSSNQIDSREELNHLLHLKQLDTLAIKSNPIMSSTASRLVLLAKFIQKARDVTVDGLAATHKEQAKIHSLRQRYGDNPDIWPIAKSIQPVYPPQYGPPVAPPMTPPPPSPGVLQVSWSIETTNPQETMKMPSSLPITTTSSSSSSLRTHSTLSLDHPLFADVVLPSPKSSYEDPSILSGFREEPDGRSESDTGNHSPAHQHTSSSPLSLTTPPCTPLPSTTSLTQGGVVTPEMISSALDALTQAASHASSIAGTPHEERHLPELITQTLSTWISDHSSCATPPSTPLDEDGTQEQPISATELIAALTQAVAAHKIEEGTSSGAPSVPSSTPQEGLMELAKLGIQPHDILEALSALSIVREEEEEIDEKERVVSSDNVNELEHATQQEHCDSDNGQDMDKETDLEQTLEEEEEETIGARERTKETLQAEEENQTCGVRERAKGEWTLRPDEEKQCIGERTREGVSVEEEKQTICIVARERIEEEQMLQVEEEREKNSIRAREEHEEEGQIVQDRPVEEQSRTVLGDSIVESDRTEPS